MRKREYHGLHNTHIYKTWADMKGRCHNKNHKAFKYYGARGIKVCKKWLDSVAAFVEDMGDKPTPKHSLDRINPNGNYTPSNCRWATPSTQLRNRRKSPNKSSKYLGVRKYEYGWIASIVVNGKRKHLGTFKTEIAAAKIRDLYAFKMFGSRTNLNFKPNKNTNGS